MGADAARTARRAAATRLSSSSSRAPVGDRVSTPLSTALLVAADHRQSGRGRARNRYRRSRRATAAGSLLIEWFSLVRLHGRIRLAAVGRGRARARTGICRRARRVSKYRAQPSRPRRSASRCCRSGSRIVLPVDLRFVLVFRIVRFFKIARYSPAMRSLLDVLYRERRALFGCLVILIGIDAGHRLADASGRRQRAARQARHHSGRDVVGDRDARHHRLWRRRAGDGARQADRRPCTIFMRARDDGAAGRHHRHRLRRADPPARFRRHLGHDRAACRCSPSSTPARSADIMRAAARADGRSRAR